MTSFAEEIQQLQSRILELVKKEKDANEKTSIDHNFKLIRDVLTEKKNAIDNNKYSKLAPFAMYYDQEVLTNLQAIYNILQTLNDRLTKLEH